MLELKNIKKIYKIGKPKDKDYQLTHALRGVDITFRDSEFVSILGPSGCGKTTLLNIIGGLDQYTSGDLVIDGRSTKQYKDKDWDNYRNNSVGFVFQSYNLIPHQTVLENVELALTLSGVSRKVRKQRAKEALEKVGLGDRVHSKPNQLSGGQMQRVAIARALVNNPEIILADEPTGALDTQTSIQVMELLKEVAKERLVVMVTHNPDIAKTYSTRIVKMLDGNMVDDSNPITEDEIKSFNKRQQKAKKEEKELAQKIAKMTPKELKAFKSEQKLAKKSQKKRKRSMSFFTALALSFKNLLTKKARTFLVSFAGSIGIIGIALVLSLSSGFNSYINTIQENTLSTYPITIKSKSIDFTSIVMSMFMDMSESTSINHDKDEVYSKENIAKLIDSVGDKFGANNLEKFYDYINDHYSELKPYVNAVKYTYDLDFSYYNSNTISSINDIQNVNASDAVINMIIIYSLYYFESKTGIQFQINENGTYTLINPTFDAENILPESEYSAKYPFVYGTGSEPTYPALVKYIKAIEKDDSSTPGRYTFINQIDVLILVFNVLGLPTDSMSTLSGGSASNMFYTDIFSEKLDNQALLEEQYELLGSSRWARSGAEYANEAMLVLDKNNEVDDYILFALGILTEEQMSSIMEGLISDNKVTESTSYDQIIGKTYKILDKVDYYVNDIDDGVVDFRDYNVLSDAAKYAKYQQYYQQAVENCSNTITIVGIIRPKSTTNIGSLSTGVVYSKDFTAQMIEHRNAKVAELGQENLTSITSIDQEIPASIQIYINTFDSKANVKAFIEKYNSQAQANDRITYSDTAGAIMSTVSTIINAITYVLIAFVSISLVVSSIMIGIITYISVLERTKEIGVLRSVGASKRDIKRVFTAESLIIGFVAGAMGIIITLLLNIPINIIISKLADISGVASLPILGAVILVAISMLLTFIAGLVPANIASKKDPVVALRTE